MSTFIKNYKENKLIEDDIIRTLLDNSLKKITMNHSNINNFLPKFLDALLINKSLQKLKLYSYNTNDNINKVCAVLNQNCNICLLDLRDNGIGYFSGLDDDKDNGVYGLANLLQKNVKIKSLSIGEKDLSKRDISLIFYALLNNKNLRKLCIECDKLNDNNFESLIKLLRLGKSLHHLVLNTETVDINQIHKFADLLHTNIFLTKLTINDICHKMNNVSFVNYESTILISNALMNNNNLKYLKISSKSIGDTEALIIADLLKTNNTLECIKLFNTNIGIKGVISLCNQSSLKYLDIEANAISSVNGVLSNYEADNEYIEHIEEYLIDYNNIGEYLIDYNNIDKLCKVLCDNTTLTQIGIRYKRPCYNFWKSIIEKLQENYCITNFIGLNLDLETASDDPLSKFLARNKKIVYESRFKKVKISK